MYTGVNRHNVKDYITITAIIKLAVKLFIWEDRKKFLSKKCVCMPSLFMNLLKYFFKNINTICYLIDPT